MTAIHPDHIQVGVNHYFQPTITADRYGSYLDILVMSEKG
ncbi:hypothetical protein SUDANB95_07879 (plasmid) [Actinosynnema sp. ALI-1.44]